MIGEEIIYFEGGEEILIYGQGDVSQVQEKICGGSFGTFWS